MASKNIIFVLVSRRHKLLDLINKIHFVRFEVFTAVTMKKAVFWDVATTRYCVNRLFEERIASIFRV
jgi:hypothetical protein